MKNQCLTLLLIACPFLLNAQNTDTFSRDTSEAHRLLEAGRSLINGRRSLDAVNEVEAAGKIILRTTGKDSKDYGTYLHLKGTIEINQNHCAEAVALFEEALTLRKKYLPADDPETGKTTNNLANAYYCTGDLIAAYDMHRQTLSIREHLKRPNPIDIAISCTNLAGILNYRGEADSAIYYREKALRIFQNTSFPRQKEYIALVEYNLGTDYYLKGDFQKAIDHTRQSIALRIALFGENDPDVAFSYSGMANNYAGAADFRSAVDYNLKALRIALQQQNTDSAFIAGTYSNLGNCYLSLPDFDSTVICHIKSLEYRKTTDNLDASFSYSNLGLVYMGQQRFDSAIASISKSLDIRTRWFGSDQHYLVIRNLNGLAACYALKKDYAQALRYLERAQKANRFDGQDYGNVLAYSELIETMHDLGEISGYMYEDTHDLNTLKRSREAFGQARTVFDYRRNAFTQNGTDYAIKGDRIWEIDEKVIEACYQLWTVTHDEQYLRSAFESMEKSKSWTLFESLQETNAIRFAGIDSTIQQAEYKLRVDIGMLEKQVAEQEDKSDLRKKDHLDISKLNGQLIKKRNELDNLKKRLVETDSAYYRLKYGETEESLSGLQKRLAPDQTVLEYFTGTFATYIFLIRKNDARFVTCPSDSLDWYVRQIRSCIDSSFDAQGMRLKSRYDRLAGSYAKAASALYTRLVGCFDKSLLSGRIVVIPDGILGYLPFELLLEEPPVDPAAFNKHSYFALEHPISYNYSATLWREMSRPDGTQFTRDLLGMAPFNGEVADCRLQRLGFSAEEIEGIHARFKGILLTGAKATIQGLRMYAPGTRILHFSTHAVVTSRKSMFNSALAFYPCQGDAASLFIHDIYAIPLHTEMVVLSACNAGIGELERGEGIISLARAFTYAGSKSIVTTLWSVNERSTKDLMIRFYENLDNGDSKETALWKAQKRYLEEHKESPTYTHPYWWAGFIPIGDMKSLRKPPLKVNSKN